VCISHTLNCIILTLVYINLLKYLKKNDKFCYIAIKILCIFGKRVVKRMYCILYFVAYGY